MLKTAASSFSCYSTDEYASIKNILLCEIVARTRTIIVRNYCQVASCEKRDYVRFKMYDDFVQNYYYVVNPLHPTNDSFRINTTTKEGYYYLDTANTSVFATPAL